MYHALFISVKQQGENSGHLYIYTCIPSQYRTNFSAGALNKHQTAMHRGSVFIEQF